MPDLYWVYLKDKINPGFVALDGQRPVAVPDLLYWIFKLTKAKLDTRFLH